GYELHGVRLVLGALGDAPGIALQQALAPADRRRHAGRLQRRHAAVPHGGHDDLAVGQELDGYGAGVPPLDDVLLDLVVAREALVDVERIELVGRHAGRHQRELELGPAAGAGADHGALAGELLGVPEVGPAFRDCALQGVGAVGEHLRPYQHLQAILEAIGRIDAAIDDVVVDLLEVVAALLQVHDRATAELRHVPFDVAGLDHGLDFGRIGARK